MKPHARVFGPLLVVLIASGLGGCDEQENPAREALTDIRNLTLIIEDNAGNCAATLAEFNAYLKEHRQAMKEAIERSDLLSKSEGAVFEEIMEVESPVVFKNFIKSKKSFEGSCKKKLPLFPYSDLIGE
ncbi:MAG TPA: hypothetical protein PK668_22790 [Myxococcota bacterium]|nr:hypothetical protein [Myxococcota bacterium]HRY95522.1 hypothetical protein [Myxococcota bacterium]HSA19924.1 hypothetical protein [Myxococcota bacterium]